MDRLNTFDIRNFSSRLNIIKEENTQLVCECPVCGGHRLTIEKKTGKYQCWSGGCECKDIREAIAPWDAQVRQPRPRVIHRQAKPKTMPPVPLPDQLVLATLPELPADIPQKLCRIDRERDKVWEILYRYSPTQEVVRTEWADTEKPKGYAKIVIPYCLDSSGKVRKGKGSQPWPLYKEDEALQHGIGKWVLLVEGEPCVEICRWLQLVGVTLQGSDWDIKTICGSLSGLKEAGVAGVLCLPDNDDAGRKKAERVEAAAAAGMPLLVVPPLALWKDMPEKGDIVDWVKWGQDQGMNREDFIRRLEEQFHAAAAERVDEENLLDAEASIPDFADRAADVKEVFCQTAFEALYSYWPWICLKNVLYCWSESQTFYKESPDVVERRRIAEFCDTYPVAHQTPSGAVYYKYDYATPEWTERVLKWVKIKLGIKPELANPPGLNCTNGVLRLSWDGDKPSWKLLDHDPSMYYTYEPLVTYDPEADLTNCDRLLEVLDKPQQEIFLRTIAASLDLPTVRKHKGRLVRALLLKGSGNNGKDTLREVVAAMYGYRGMTGATLTDFAAYDEGRKFPLSRLSNSRVNWASENANFAVLDKIQSLKAFITGDPLDIEHKGKDHYEITPVGVGLFNVNETPSLQASLEAILSRYGVLTFSKTFKIGADPSKGELEADPRFKYDPSFLRSEVLPAFLNRVLDSLTCLMAEGIDYSCTVRALEDIQAENSHLFQFCQATGLGYDPNGRVYAGEIWEQLEQWYQAQGALTYEEGANGKKKAIWSPFSDKRSDELVKSANQVVKRFQSLFPKSKRGNDKHKVYLVGLSFTPNGSSAGKKIHPTGEPIEAIGEPMVRQLVSLEPLQNKESEPGEPICPAAGDEENYFVSVGEEIAEENENVSGAENLAHLAHHPVTARDTGSPIASPDGSLGSPMPHEAAVTAQVTPTPASASEPEATTTAPTVPTSTKVAGLILQCSTWSAMLDLLDSVAAKVGKSRTAIYNCALKHIDLEDRQHLVRLLTEHIQEFPRDQWAYSWLPESSRKLKEKALALVDEMAGGDL